MTWADDTTPAPPSFTDWLALRVGTRRWCVARRLTARLREKGYRKAIPASRYAALEQEYERWVYGAPLDTLRAAAPEMLRALRVAATHVVGVPEIDRAIARAEGRAA